MEVKDLERKIDELIHLCDVMEKKQAVMESDKESWIQERTRLLEKNNLAKNKVEAMIMRLKSLQHE